MKPHLSVSLWKDFLIKIFFLCFCLLLLTSPLLAQQKDSSSLRDDPLTSRRTKWFREAKFGMFIHWGIYAVPAGIWKGQRINGLGEWIMNNARIPVSEYEQIAKQFNPVRFNAREWVRLAKRAGMRYLVITSKHHDGFCMFDSQLTDYDIVDATPYHHDVMKDLAKACREEGIKLCFYYSILDWHHPDQKNNFPRYVEYMKGQIKELITQYGPLGILWFDGQWIPQWNDEYAKDLETYVRSLQPSIIINNRIGKGRSTDGDYDTPEQFIPGQRLQNRLWETCMTINDTWGYKSYDNNWKSATDLIRKLIDIASKGGNFLLNVGPTAEGVIPQPSVERLEEMGKWLKVNGEAIYGTTASPYHRYPFEGRCTVKKNILYVHLFHWPEEGVRLTGIKGRIERVKLLDRRLKGFRYEIKESEGQQEIILYPPSQRDPHATVVALHFQGRPEVETSLLLQPALDGSLHLLARDAEVHGQSAQYESGNGKDNIGYWTRLEDYVTWDFQVPKAQRYRVDITYACEDNTAGGEYQVNIGQHQLRGQVKPTGSWTSFRTETLGEVFLSRGKYTVEVRPLAIPRGALMNLQSLRLIPLEK